MKDVLVSWETYHNLEKSDYDWIHQNCPSFQRTVPISFDVGVAYLFSESEDAMLFKLKFSCTM